MKLGRAVIEQYRENAGHNDSAILVRHDKTVFISAVSLAIMIVEFFVLKRLVPPREMAFWFNFCYGSVWYQTLT